MKQIYLFVLLVAMAVALNTSCSEQADFPKLEDTEITAKFDVKLAKEAFVRDYTAAVEARSETTRAQSQIYYTLADTDYTPLWDKATTAENEHVWSIDVPLYSVSGAFVSDTDGENMRMATQKLIVIQSKKSGDTFSYLLTLCPDVACAEKYSDLNDVFTHLGDCSKFSGLAIYTDLAGELVAVNKFVNGTEAGYVYVGNPEADQHALHHKAEHLMEGMKFYLSSGPVEMTRGGGMDFIHEMLCRKCLSYPCECYYPNMCDKCGGNKDITDPFAPNACTCDAENLDICPWCGKPKEQDPIFGKCDCNNIEDNFCDKCGQRLPEDGDCNCDNDPSMECPDCHSQTCICTACPICGDKTCRGCGSTNNPPSGNEDDEDPNDDICEYCNYHCGRTCEAYCHCGTLKAHCTEHKCVSCGKFYYQCECK